MDTNIEPSISEVNRSIYLPGNKQAYKLARMTYGERLKLARTQAGLTQEALAKLVGMKQPSLAYLENPDSRAKGSEFTVKLARVLGVSIEWLDDEIGEMHPTIYSTSDPKLVSILKALEPQAEYVKDAAASAVLTTCELAERAKANGNGTHG